MEFLPGTKYDCDACGATVDGRFVEVHQTWHTQIELMAKTVAEAYADRERTQR